MELSADGGGDEPAAPSLEPERAPDASESLNPEVTDAADAALDGEGLDENGI